MPATSLLRRHVTSPDPDATSALGASLAAVARPGDLLCLWGDLGAGKTHLAKAFGAGLGVRETVTSPSFVLMSEYAGRLPMFHVDLYRLADAADVLAGGLLDDDRWAGGVTLIEWPERMGDAIPRGTPRRRHRGLRRRPARDRADRPRRAPPALPGGRPVSAATAGEVVLAIDTATTRIAIGIGTHDGRCARGDELAGRLPPRRDAPAGARAAARRPRASTGGGSPRSSSAPGRARSPGCGWASRPRRASRTGWAGRSSGSRRRPPCCPPPRASMGSQAGHGVLLLPAGPSDRILVREGRGAGPAPGGSGARARPGGRPGRGRPRWPSPGRGARPWRVGA